jgi:hypothetical protein
MYQNTHDDGGGVETDYDYPGTNTRGVPEAPDDRLRPWEDAAVEAEQMGEDVFYEFNGTWVADAIRAVAAPTYVTRRDDGLEGRPTVYLWTPNVVQVVSAFKQTTANPEAVRVAVVGSIDSDLATLTENADGHGSVPREQADADDWRIVRVSYTPPR